MQTSGPRRRLTPFIAPAAAALAVGAGAAAQDLPTDGDAREIVVWATPGMLRNPVAFALDPWGNAYIAETDRAGNAVTDTRQLEHLDGVASDLRLRTVEDRRALIQRWIEQGAFEPDYFTKTSDRVRLVRDIDGDGVADDSRIFAGGFNDAVDGIGAGVLWRDGQVYYTCIPHLWRLRDADGDGEAEQRESLSYGYGVRWCFYGHDLHGLVNGPDGRIYFSLGDRGFNIETPEGERLVGPDRGAVFRCWPDGSGLELFCVGLRNPQELAFDEFGNLFTGDNNSDSGDRARVVYCMEGSDAGWRQNVQSLPSRGPWNRERMWHLAEDPRDPTRPAWSLPPIDHVGAGPSGLAYYPGTGESYAYDDTFLMVDFYGSGATVHTFRARPEGAGFALADKGVYYRGTTVTDIAWGPDGRLYLSDWGEGWGPNDKGNMFTIVNRTVHEDPRGRREIEEVRSLLGAGFDSRQTPELIDLLGHDDQRVRLGAQYALAPRGIGAVPPLADLAADAARPLLGRIHAVWCLGQIARSETSAAESLLPLLADPHDQIRLATVRTLGDLGLATGEAVRRLLQDPAPAVIAAAGTALGKSGDAAALPHILDALEANGDADQFLRHGLVYGLARLNKPDEMIETVSERGRSARLGAALALRRLENPGVAAFLSDPDAQVAAEAARAVYDHATPLAMPALAAKLDPTLPEPLLIEPFLRRAIEANVRLGGPAEADRLARFAALGGAPAEFRRLALERLRDWDLPLAREGVWGNPVDLPPRPTDDARRAVLGNLDAIRSAAAGSVELLELADALEAKYRLDLDLAASMDALADGARGESSRLVMLEQIAARAPDALARACGVVLEAPASATTPLLRMRARTLLMQADAEAGLAAYRAAFADADTLERQDAAASLGKLDSPEAGAWVRETAERLLEGSLDASVALEVFLAAAGAGDEPAALAEQVAAWEPHRPPGFQTALLASGGNAERGRELFLHHETAQCARCHAVAGEVAVGVAGPDLTGIGARADRATLVESMVEPNAQVTPGYGAVSAMPQMSLLLTPAETRDVVAYLASLTGGEPPRAAPARVADLRPDSGPAPGGRADGQTPDPAGSRGALRPFLWAGLYVLVLLPIGIWLLVRLIRER